MYGKQLLTIWILSIYHPVMDSIHVKIKSELFRRGIHQRQVAQMMNIEASVFSRIMRGVRPMPEGMEARIYAALDRLEAAERAADEARRRVLDGDDFDHR